MGAVPWLIMGHLPYHVKQILVPPLAKWARARYDQPMTTDDLLKKIRAHLAHTGMSPSYFGYLAVCDGKLISRLENGGQVTLRTAARVLAFIENRGGFDDRKSKQ